MLHTSPLPPSVSPPYYAAQADEAPHLLEQLLHVVVLAQVALETPLKGRDLLLEVRQHALLILLRHCSLGTMRKVAEGMGVNRGA